MVSAHNAETLRGLHVPDGVHLGLAGSSLLWAPWSLPLLLPLGDWQFTQYKITSHLQEFHYQMPPWILKFYEITYFIAILGPSFYPVIFNGSSLLFLVCEVNIQHGYNLTSPSLLEEWRWGESADWFNRGEERRGEVQQLTTRNSLYKRGLLRKCICDF